MGRKFGVSFSWKRAVGISAAKGKIARMTGIPTTRGGRQRKVGRLVGRFMPFGFLLPEPRQHVEYAEYAAAPRRNTVAGLATLMGIGSVFCSFEYYDVAMVLGTIGFPISILGLLCVMFRGGLLTALVGIVLTIAGPVLTVINQTP